MRKMNERHNGCSEDVMWCVVSIMGYLDHYPFSYLEKFGVNGVIIPWEEFSEKNKKMLLEKDYFDISVRDKLCDEGIIMDKNKWRICDEGVLIAL